MAHENDRIGVTNASEVAQMFNTLYGSIADYPVDLYDGLNNITLKDVMNKHSLHESIVEYISNISMHVFIHKSANDIIIYVN